MRLNEEVAVCTCRLKVSNAVDNGILVMEFELERISLSIQ